MIYAEKKYGTGYVPDITSPKDYIFTAAAQEEEFDWEKGYDVEEELRAKLGDSRFILKPNDQEFSSSCVAQAIAKYAEVKYMLKTGKISPAMSPRYIYSHIYLPNGGSYANRGMDFVKDNGVVADQFMPSAPMTEKHLRDKRILEDNLGNDFELLKDLIKGGSYLTVWLDNLDRFAKALAANGGLVFGVSGQNNGTWHLEFPIAPESIDEIEWSHFIYAGRAKMINGKKRIGILNSWGQIGNRGWQWLDETHVNQMLGYSGKVWTPEVGKIDRLEIFQLIDQYVLGGKLEWNKDDVWAVIQQEFDTNISRGLFYDYLQVKRYL